MQVIGLCRFSYPAEGGFQVGHESAAERAAYLYDPARLEERFVLFETVALPGLLAQTDPDFELVVVVGDAMPPEALARLKALLAPLPGARIEAHPPGPHRKVMKQVLNAARRDASAPCLQFRFDDDDAVAVDFVERLRRAAQVSEGLCAGHKTVAFDWNSGMNAAFGAGGVAVAETHRAFFVAALGMYVRGGCRLSIMNFAHDRLPRFMPAVSYPEPLMYLRGLNGFNDSRQGKVKPIALAPATPAQEALIAERFAIDLRSVRRGFEAIGARGKR